MVVSTQENGLIMKCMEKALSPGKTAGNTLDHMCMIRKKVMASLHGLTAKYMMECGVMENKMARQCLWIPMEKAVSENGNRAREFLNNINDSLIQS